MVEPTKSASRLLEATKYQEQLSTIDHSRLKLHHMKQLVAICLVIILAGCFGSEPEKTGKEGKPLPEFSLLLTDSVTKLHSNDIPKGNPFVLFYMSPYCPHCKKQITQIIEDIDNLKNIHFYCITNYSLAELNAFINLHKLDKYKNITCGIDSANILADYFEISGIPYLAIYNKDKVLNKAFLGEIYTSQILKAADQ